MNYITAWYNGVLPGWFLTGSYGMSTSSRTSFTFRDTLRNGKESASDCDTLSSGREPVTVTLSEVEGNLPVTVTFSAVEGNLPVTVPVTLESFWLGGLAYLLATV